MPLSAPRRQPTPRNSRSAGHRCGKITRSAAFMAHPWRAVGPFAAAAHRCDTELPFFRKDFQRLLSASLHRADIRNCAVADAPDTEFGQALSVGGTPSITITLTGNATPSQIRPISASSRKPGTKKTDTQAAAYAFARSRASPIDFAGSPSWPRNKSVRALMKRSTPLFSAAS